MKVAVITPYYKESIETLKRCHESVLNQTHDDVFHVLVSDGSPLPELDSWNAIHIVGPNHGDYGDTPRAMGSLSAITKGADALVFLDADNWLEPKHIEEMRILHEATNADLVTATRMLHRLDGSILGVCNESDGVNFNDTNCYFLTRPAYGALIAWCAKDQREGLVGDRIFWNTILRANFTKTHCSIPTVHYTTNFAFHYQVNGLMPPADSKVIFKLPEDQYHRLASYAEYEKIVADYQKASS